MSGDLSSKKRKDKRKKKGIHIQIARICNPFCIAIYLVFYSCYYYCSIFIYCCYGFGWNQESRLLLKILRKHVVHARWFYILNRRRSVKVFKSMMALFLIILVGNGPRITTPASVPKLELLASLPTGGNRVLSRQPWSGFLFIFLG